MFDLPRINKGDIEVFSVPSFLIRSYRSPEVIFTLETPVRTMPLRLLPIPSLLFNGPDFERRGAEVECHYKLVGEA